MLCPHWVIVRTQSENKSNQASSVKPGVGKNPPKCLEKTLNLVCGLPPQVFALFKCSARVFAGFALPPSSCCYTNDFSNSPICFGDLNLTGYHKSDQGPLKPMRGPSTLGVLPTGVGCAPLCHVCDGMAYFDDSVRVAAPEQVPNCRFTAGPGGVHSTLPCW